METDALFPLAGETARVATGRLAGSATSEERPAPAHTAGPGTFAPPPRDAPLAVKMRPATIDDLVGQQHLLAPGAPLRRLVSGQTMTSVILWGPPGTGKTTIAHLVA